MQNDTDPTEAPQGEAAPEEQVSPPDDGGEQPSDDNPVEEAAPEEAEPEARDPHPAGAQPLDGMDLQELIAQVAQVIQPMISQILRPKAPPARGCVRPPQQPPAQIAMPRDVAHRLLMELYAPKKKPEETNRSFRVGMGFGSAVTMMGVQVLSEDMAYMIGSAFKRVMGGNKAPDLSDVQRGAYPVAQPYDPIENFDMGPGSVRMPEGTLGIPERMHPASVAMPGVNVGGAPPDVDSSDVVEGLRMQAETRWADIKKHDPAKAEAMSADVGGIEDIFAHFQDLFGDLFPLSPSAAEPAPEPDPEPEASPDENPEDA